MKLNLETGTYKLGVPPSQSSLSMDLTQSLSYHHCSYDPDQLIGEARIVRHELPDAVFLGEIRNLDELSNITLKLIGEPPFSITYLNGREFKMVKGIESNFYTFPTIHPGEIQILSISDIYCNNTNVSTR